jgi:hypothetical protein
MKDFENHKTFFNSSKSVQLQTQNRFAGTAAKGTKFSSLQLMTTQVTLIADLHSTSTRWVECTRILTRWDCIRHPLEANLEHPCSNASILVIFFRQQKIADFKTPFNL